MFFIQSIINSDRFNTAEQVIEAASHEYYQYNILLTLIKNLS